MTITVGLVAFIAHVFLHVPLGIGVLLGAILAPTDPVLASDVQVEHSRDRDRLRFTLTAEAGLNDGAAFPFVMLGLGLLGQETSTSFYVRWFTLDVLWATLFGLLSGAVIGTAIGRLIVYVRTKHKEAFGFDECLTLGLIALSYGVAVLAHGYGFLAVFAAGLCLRRIERQHTPAEAPDVLLAVKAGAVKEIATSSEQAPAYMTQAVLGFNEQLERLGELTLVMLVAGILTIDYLPQQALWFVPVLLCVVRPVSIMIGTLGANCTNAQRLLMSWFGIRGIGSLYYLTYALNHGIPAEYAKLLIGLTLTTVAASIVLHGISVTPLMNRYARTNQMRARRSGA
jgi:NhaP-type Na+/H+ or K+/H+ antiporter